MNKNKRIQVSFNDEDMDFIRQAAKEARCTMVQIVRVAVQNYREDYLNKPSFKLIP